MSYFYQVLFNFNTILTHFLLNIYYFSTTKRRKHADKVGKGLRHFSMKVCEKVRNKGFTSYNEVADELVLEFATGIHGSADSQVCFTLITNKFT